MAKDKFYFDKILKNMELVKKTIPQKLANVSKRYFLDAFRLQQWEGKPWQQVNRRIPGTPEYKYPKKTGLGRRTRSILVQSGKLRRAVSTSLKEVTSTKVKFVIDANSVPYAKVHNDGLMSGRGNGFKMPKRKFMGDSKKLRELQLKTIKDDLNKIWKV